MSSPDQDTLSRIHAKRRTFQSLTEEEFMLLLADCVMDRQLFSGPNWNWRYGGVRYAPSELPRRDPSRILVLLWPGSLGDVCMSAPFFSVLRRKYPSSKIEFLSGGAAEIFEGNLDLDRLVPNPIEAHVSAHLSGRPLHFQALVRDIRSLVTRLWKRKYDLLINLQILPMSAALAKLSGAKQTIGMTLTDDGMPMICGNVWAPYLFGVSANLMRRFNLLHRTEIFNLIIDEARAHTPEPVIHIDSGAVRRVQDFLDANGVSDGDLLVGMNPMAGTPIRQWSGFHELIPMIVDQLRARIIVFSAKDEEHHLDEILQRSGGKAIKAAHFSLQELMAAISGCNLFISNDTGPLHLACLLKRRVIALFGPTGFREVGPWQTEYHVLQSSGCRECFKQSCDKPQEYCMERIEAPDVAGLSKALLQNRPGTQWAGFRNDKVLYASSETLGAPAPNLDPEIRFGMSLLKFISKENGCVQSTVQSSHAGSLLAHEYRDFGNLARKCIQYLKHKDFQMLSAAHRELFKVHPFFQPVLALNDFIYLDKRMNLIQDPASYLRFYEALLNDLGSLMDCLVQHEEESIQKQKGMGAR